MNGRANEGLLIDYGENRVLLTLWTQLQGVQRHFVNALFSQSAQLRGSLYRPPDRHWHCTSKYYACNISLSSYMIYNIKILLNFLAHASIYMYLEN